VLTNSTTVAGCWPPPPLLLLLLQGMPLTTDLLRIFLWAK
jgi:hypothetical protein